MKISAEVKLAPMRLLVECEQFLRADPREAGACCIWHAVLAQGAFRRPELEVVTRRKASRLQEMTDRLFFQVDEWPMIPELARRALAML
jgi:hypothetical protein